MGGFALCSPVAVRVETEDNEESVYQYWEFEVISITEDDHCARCN